MIGYHRFVVRSHFRCFPRISKFRDGEVRTVHLPIITIGTNAVLKRLTVELLINFIRANFARGCFPKTY
jgi:hypothetical protein